LHQELRRLVRNVALLALLTCLVAATLFAWRDGSWTAGLLVGLTLAMSIVPEEFAVVWTVMLALGAWRLARQHVLTRQPQAIEALGTTSVLCVDKTGTLTCNRMEVVALHDGEHALRRAPGDSLPAAFDRLLRGAALASVREGLEPMDQAIFRLASPAAADGLQPLRREAVLPGRPFVRRCWRKQGEAEVLFALKGAPEAVLARCLQAPQQQQTVHAQTQAWAARGLRVIAVASGRGVDEAAPPESGYELLGLLGFQDPVRDDVPAALQACRDAGVRVVMITGDAAATALAIARNAGLVRDEAPAAVLAGAQLDAMNEAEFEQAVVGVSVFARVTPAQKLRIVQALQRRGEVVAMTGDGVNDGPALRAADIGVTMGQRGTDVAREAAALVLLDDRFASLVDAVRAGRRIFANLQQAMGYLFAAHVPIVGLSLLPLFGGPVLLLPIHVVLLELIIDPACSLVFEAEPLAADGMRVPPRRSNSPLFSLDAIARALAVGVMALLAVVIVQWLGHRAVLSDPALRLAGLSTIVVGNLVMLQWFRGGLRRSRPTNRVFVGLLLGVSLLSVVLLLTPPMSAALGFPAGLDARWVLAALCLPAAWALWRLVSPARRNPS
jgi:Ca2+-transporting ATPase